MSDIYWLNADSRKFLERGYLQEEQTPEERIREIAESAEHILKITGFADKFERYMHNGWISLSSPVWANFGTNRGLPISCNNSYVDDSIADILKKTAEIGMQTKTGAGTSAYLGALRPRGSDISSGGKTYGPVHFAELLQVTTNIISQSNVRRGSCAVYLDVEHPDIMEFLDMREEGSPIQNLSMGVCVTDQWMTDMVGGDKDKRKIWMRILKKRFETGYPYIFFTDTVNNNRPQVYKDKNLKVHSANLCAEITLASNVDESFVCNLSSLNVLHYDDWKNTDLVKTVTYFLDAVMTEYIEKTKDIPFMNTAHNFAKRHRALGIGVLGWHSLLQSKMIAFEDQEAMDLNIDIARHMDEESLIATHELAALFGEPELLEGYGIRNVTRLAIAPTTSSSFILGQISPSIEPLNSNYFTKDLAKGKFTYKNPYLKELLKKYKMDTKEVWHDILLNGGSVLHLNFLTDHEKNVFKTFGEISPNVVIAQAADRQKYIDQSQSLNIMIHPNTPLKDVNMLLIEAWQIGVKTLYYQRSTSPQQEFSRSLISCKSCEL
jgi:ribonucleoside-diphosphate reductase alpha chain